MKKTILYSVLALVIIVLIIGAIRFLTPEDTWLCQKGEWVKHGNPSAAAPTTGCGEAKACTTEAKVCPDGSAVGRTGPNCEFSPCPGEKSVTFFCDNNRKIQAKFYLPQDTYVDLVLSDGRSLQLPHAISASGARYANADESLVFWNKGDTAFLTENATTTFANCVLYTDNNTGLANPASVNCTAKGGTLKIQKNSKGGEYGVCFFEDNRQCEEWALLRGQCPVGGLKVTGYQTDAQIYCAITGGTVEGMDSPVPMCKRIDGTYCNAESNFNGDCPDPNDPNPSAGNVEAP
ncbi:MAG: DUF333 domain-containing protein [Patescibacteria group bacterium]|nr:DUF333 domain-containing protein [Patescibacteria group bacterium]